MRSKVYACARPTMFAAMLLGLASCSTVPYRQPITELAIASQQVYEAMGQAAKQAEADARATFGEMFASNPQMRSSLKVEVTECTEERIEAGGSCQPYMTIPDTQLKLYPHTDYSRVLGLSRALAVYTAWLYKIANADTCSEVDSNLALTMAQAKQLLALSGSKKAIDGADGGIDFANRLACLAIEKRKLDALKQATNDSKEAVAEATDKIKEVLDTRIEIQKTALEQSLIMANRDLRITMRNKEASDADKARAAQSIIILSQQMEALFKWKLAVTDFADRLSAGHTALANQLQKSKPDYAAVYQAVQSMLTGSATLEQNLRPGLLKPAMAIMKPVVGRGLNIVREGQLP